MKINQLIYKLTLLAIFVSAVLRAYFVTPLFDEAATFLHYIIPGNGWNPGEYADANNHILISLFGSWCLELGFDHHFFMRIPSLIGFAIYGIALHILFFKQLKIKYAQFIVICTYSIPWILEYGALARGYGFAIGCYIMLIVLLIEFTKQTKIRHFALFFTLAWLTILSSFTFTVPVFLLLGVSFVYMLSTIKTQQKKILISYFLIGCLFLLAYIPLFQRAIILKESGALWWGSSEGLWPVTGTSISKLVLFSSHWSIRLLINGVTLLAAILWVKKLIATKPKEWFSNPFLWIIAYILGLILALIVLARIFNMNYPMDRVGMYLVPLFIILITFIVSELKNIRWGIFLIAFFPITFLYHYNLKFTLFSPEDLLTDNAYSNIKSIIKEDKQASAEWMLYINYLYKSRNDQHKNIIALAAANNQTDYFINYGTYPSHKIENYKRLFTEDRTYVGLYVKENKKSKLVAKTFETQKITITQPEYYFLELDSTSNFIKEWSQNPYSIQIDGNFEMKESAHVLKIVVEATDKLGNHQLISHTNLHHTFYPQKEIKFNLSTLTFNTDELTKIKFRLENPTEVPIKINTLNVKFQNENDKQ